MAIARGDNKTSRKSRYETDDEDKKVYDAEYDRNSLDDETDKEGGDDEQDNDDYLEEDFSSPAPASKRPRYSQSYRVRSSEDSAEEYDRKLPSVALYEKEAVEARKKALASAASSSPLATKTVDKTLEKVLDMIDNGFSEVNESLLNIQQSMVNLTRKLNEVSKAVKNNNTTIDI